MKSVQKALFLMMCAALWNVNGALAQEATAPEQSSKSRAVLFKIHDITPVENTEGVVTSCDFLVTFYNRTPEGMRPAKINMGWTDDVSERYFSDEETPAEDAAAQKQTRQVRQNRREETTLGTITAGIDMPTLAAGQQTTVKGTIKSEKCFVLLSNLNFKVENCGILGRENTQNPTSRRATTLSAASLGECANLFEYVDPKNPEYYEEFKSISYTEQENLLKNEKKTNLDNVNAKSDEIVSKIEKVEGILQNIQ